MYVENAVIQTRRLDLELLLKPRYIDKIGKFVKPGSAGNIRVSIEIKLIGSTANASLQCALDRNWRGYYNIQYGEGGQFLTLIEPAARHLRWAKLGSFLQLPPLAATKRHSQGGLDKVPGTMTTPANFLVLGKQRFTRIFQLARALWM